MLLHRNSDWNCSTRFLYSSNFKARVNSDRSNDCVSLLHAIPSPIFANSLKNLKSEATNGRPWARASNITPDIDTILYGNIIASHAKKSFDIEASSRYPKFKLTTLSLSLFPISIGLSRPLSCLVCLITKHQPRGRSRLPRTSNPL